MEARRGEACWQPGSTGRRAAHRTLFLALAVTLLSSAAASSGDESWAFRRCHATCSRTGCIDEAPAADGANATAAAPATSPRQCSSVCGHGGGSPAAAPLALRLWRWDCAADCSYLCMWRLEGERPLGATPRKYFGKWPFQRLGGMQEPASVAFSLANLAAHAHCLARLAALRRSLAGQRRRSRGGKGGGGGKSSGGGSSEEAAPAGYRLWRGYMLLSVNAWAMSAVFHGRDTHTTERLDYLSAAALIFYNLFLSLARTCRLRSRAALAAAAAPLALFWAHHCHFMLTALFDYGYHMRVCLAAGAAQSLLWLAWAALATPRPPGRAPLLAFILAVNACMALEVLDFPPLWAALDAHACWHAATAPLVYLFYRFVAADLSAAAASAAAATAASAAAGKSE